LTGGYLLPERVFLITGAARGIGLEVARMAHARGASVVLTDVEGSGVEQAADLVGSRAIGLVADVRDAGQVEAAFEAAVERFGRVDVVVANAGIAPPITTVRSVDPEDWERVVDVNLMGVWRTVRAGLPQVLANRGQFVLVSSSYAFMNGVLNSPYATAKAGVEALGRGLRAELLPRGASATVAYFGWIKTELVRKAFADPVVDRMRHEAVPSLLTRRIPVRRAGSAIIKGVEARAPRVIVPFEWRLLFWLRGVLGPFTDLGFERDPGVAEIVREAEERSSRLS
jgi:NAD(P)-dependent dehydrogenase (short-subunit alcohol dehydrogenase family)